MDAILTFLGPRRYCILTRSIVVLGASGGIGQVSSVCQSHRHPLMLAWNILLITGTQICLAAISVAESEPSHRRACPVRRGQHSRCCCRFVSHFLRCRTIHPSLLVYGDLDKLMRRQKISGHLPSDDGLKNALTGADVVVIPAGIPSMFSLPRLACDPTSGMVLTASREARNDS